MEEKIEYVICEHAVHQVKPESLRPPALTENFRTYCIVIIYSVFYSVPQRAISVLYRSVYCYILFRYLGFFLQRIQYDNSPVTQKNRNYGYSLYHSLRRGRDQRPSYYSFATDPICGRKFRWPLGPFGHPTEDKETLQRHELLTRLPAEDEETAPCPSTTTTTATNAERRSQRKSSSNVWQQL